MNPTERVRLGRTDIEVTRLGLGTAPLGGLYREVPDEQGAALLEHAWAAGLRLFDTAPQYGKGLAERRVVYGHALRNAFIPLLTVIGLTFAVLMAISRQARIFSAVHDVDRRTYGEILFPLGVALLAAVFPHGEPYVYGVLVLGLADGLAALVGTRYGRVRLPGGKSVWGSLTFFVEALAAALALVGATYVALVAAVALTAAEASLRHGFDNLVVPSLAALLLSLA